MNSGERMKGSHEGGLRQVCSQFQGQLAGICNGRPIWTIDCRKFDDPDNDRSLRKHIGRNPKIMKSTLESGNYHDLHGRLYDGTHWFFADVNTPFPCCTCLSWISGKTRV